MLIRRLLRGYRVHRAGQRPAFDTLNRSAGNQLGLPRLGVHPKRLRRHIHTPNAADAPVGVESRLRGARRRAALRPGVRACRALAGARRRALLCRRHHLRAPRNRPARPLRGHYREADQRQTRQYSHCRPPPCALSHGPSLPSAHRRPARPEMFIAAVALGETSWCAAGFHVPDDRMAHHIRLRRVKIA